MHVDGTNNSEGLFDAVWRSTRQPINVMFVPYAAVFQFMGAMQLIQTGIQEQQRLLSAVVSPE